MTDDPVALVLLSLAGLLAGGINAIAGGGSLLVFPALLGAGLDPLEANVTNSVAQTPGYAGIAVGSRRELRGRRRRIVATSMVAAAGGTVGALLLLVLPEAVFDGVVPALVFAASVLMAVKPRLSRWMAAHREQDGDHDAVLLPVVFLAAVYGGYFGGALGVILIVTLSLFADDTLHRLNALKGLLSLVIALASLVVFVVDAPIEWLGVALLAPATLVGGYLGAKVATRLPEPVLRAAVVLIGLGVTVYLVFFD